MNWVEAGFWFLLGFIAASWLAYKARLRAQTRAANSFAAVRAEVLRLLDAARDLTEVRVTIIDRNGELELETEEDPPAAPSSRPPKDLH